MKYQYNDIGVCLNPDEIKVIYTDDCKCVVKTAQDSNGKWHHSIDCMLKYSGYSAPVSLNEAGCNTQDEAYIKGLNDIKRFLQKNDKNNYIKLIYRELENKSQLTLF